MSYKIYAFLPIAGVDPLDTGMHLAYNREERLTGSSQTGDLDAAELAQFLKREWPALQEVRYDLPDFDDERQEFSAEDETQDDLVLVDEQSKVHVELGAGIVHFSIPRALAPASAQVAFGQIWGCLSELQRERGYIAYDPQIGQILALSDDLPIALGSYVKMLKYLPGMVEIESAIVEPQEEDQGVDESPWYRRR